MRIAIVADDLTSAGDAAAPFRAAGFPAVVTLGPAPGVPVRCGATAVDVDSRAKTVLDATRRIAAATAGFADADVLVKTIDSTLRGHLLAETEAALSASGRRTAIVAPAFPAEGRTTAGAVQYVGDQPVDRTWFADDPTHPVRCADLLRIYRDATPVSPRQAAAGDGLGVRLRRLIGTARYVVADAASDRDLDNLVAAVPRTEQVLWVGSPGLAAALARRLAPRSPRPASRAGTVHAVGDPAGRILFVVGSLHPASRAQLTRLRETGTDTIQLPDGEGVGPAYRLGEAVGLYGPREPVERASVPAILATATTRLVATRTVGALVLTGGETARTALLALGARTIELIGEVEPGIPFGELDVPERFPVAFKAGGFGNPDTLVRVRQLLTRAGPRGGHASHSHHDG